MHYSNTVCVNCIFSSSDTLRYNFLCFVSKKAIYCCVSISNKVKPCWLELLEVEPLEQP